MFDLSKHGAPNFAPLNDGGCDVKVGQKVIDKGSKKTGGFINRLWPGQVVKVMAVYLVAKQEQK